VQPGRIITPPVEGTLATRNPFASVPSPAGGHTAGINGVTLGRFGWADPDTGQVSNALLESDQSLGFVLPQWGTWNRLYSQDGTWILREGLMVILASRGDFWCRFAAGANPGQQVFASTQDGSAAVGILGPEWTADSVITADSIFYTADGGGWMPTQWTTVMPICAGGLGVISSSQEPYWQ
jgi:hypothetical protein